MVLVRSVFRFIFDVIVPIIDVTSDISYSLDLYLNINYTLWVYMHSDNYLNDTCFDAKTNVSYTPSKNINPMHVPSDNVSCIDSRSSLIYTPLNRKDNFLHTMFVMSGNNALFNKMIIATIN